MIVYKKYKEYYTKRITNNTGWKLMKPTVAINTNTAETTMDDDDEYNKDEEDRNHQNYNHERQQQEKLLPNGYALIKNHDYQ